MRGEEEEEEEVIHVTDVKLISGTIFWTRIQIKVNRRFGCRLLWP